jgi:hypothetical protein
VAKKRCELLTKYARRYDVEFDDDTFSAIHSITFLNSLCIIRKAATESSLGRRSVNGRHAEITEFPLQMAGRNLVSPDQGAEPWTNYAFSSEEQLMYFDAASRESDVRIATLRDALAERDAMLAERERRINTLEAKVGALYASTSWRITAPLRAARRRQIWLSLVLSDCVLSIVRACKTRKRSYNRVRSDDPLLRGRQDCRRVESGKTRQGALARRERGRALDTPIPNGNTIE